MKSCPIVDDSRFTRMIAKTIRQELAFETVEAEGGQQGLNACQESMPEGVMPAWNIPAMNGMKYLRELRVLPSGDKPAVVFCAAEGYFVDILAATETGAAEYTRKPFDREMVQTEFSQVGLL